jgi:hypothetical protein
LKKAVDKGTLRALSRAASLSELFGRERLFRRPIFPQRPGQKVSRGAGNDILTDTSNAPRLMRLSLMPMVGGRLDGRQFEGDSRNLIPRLTKLAAWSKVAISFSGQPPEGNQNESRIN